MDCKLADLVLVDGDPLGRLNTMGNIELVISDGEIVYEDKRQNASTAP